MYDFEGKTIEQLRFLLNLFLAVSTEEDMNVAYLDELLNAMDRVDPLPEDTRLDPQESLAKFKKKYAHLFPVEG